MLASDDIARLYYQNKEYEKAFAAYLELIEIFPERDDLYISCGNCCDVFGNKHTAIQYYLKAYKLNKKSLPALTNLATACYEIDDLKSAEKYCRKALRLDSENVSAMIIFGNIMYRRKEYAEALNYYLKAAELKPDYFIAELNLANTYFDLKNYDLSLLHAKRSTELESASIQAWTLRGNSALEIQDFEEALTAFLSALKLDSEDPWLYNYLSQVYQKKGMWKAALENGWMAVEKSNGSDDQHINFGYLLYEAELEKADSLIKHYAKIWQEKYSDNQIVSHTSSAIQNNASVTAANSGYVRNIFDVFAPDFEQVLSGLEYRAPDLISGFLEEIYGTESKPKLRILDAGCGTGLCGKFLKNYAGWFGLDGVDLSAGMLKEAKAKKVYSHLYQEELVAYLQSRKSRYDLIVSADVFTYIGNLENLFLAAASALKKNGRLVFTVTENSVNNEDWFLHASGRFLHKKKYIERLLKKAGFQIEKINREKLRREGDAEVMGYVISSCKTGV